MSLDPRLAAILASNRRAMSMGAVPPIVARAHATSFMGSQPLSDVRPFGGPRDTLQRMAQHALGARGEQSALVRQFTEWCIRDVHPKDYLGEILAIRNVFVQWSLRRPTAPLFRYTNDPRHVEMIKDPERIVQEIVEQGTSLVDCFPTGTLVLTDAYKLVPIESVRPGMKIWGLDRWSEVKNFAYKGILSVDAVKLNNGSVMKLTGDHHVLVAICDRHGHRKNGRKRPCHCSVADRRMEKMRVSDLEDGMVLPSPDRIPFGSDSSDPDVAYVEGLYVADGWCNGNSGFSISGQDGCPKEEQKREVQDIAKKLGYPTGWSRKSIRVNSCHEWVMRMQQMGNLAPEKHLLSLDLGKEVAEATIRGVMADSGANHSGAGRTFTTTSYELAVQMRVLHKMFGKTCGYSHIENHGGLGKNPIWRLNVRGERVRGNAEKILRVSSIERNVISVPCVDIETDDHHVYLPEHDVTVQNCDDSAQMAGTMLLQIGREVELVAMGFEPKTLSHVAVRAREPKSGKMIILDGVAGPREAEAAGRAKELLIWSLN